MREKFLSAFYFDTIHQSVWFFDFTLPSWTIAEKQAMPDTIEWGNASQRNASSCRITYNPSPILGYMNDMRRAGEGIQFIDNFLELRGATSIEIHCPDNKSPLHAPARSEFE